MRVLQLISSGGNYGAEGVVINLAKSLRVLGLPSIIGVFDNSQNRHVEIAEVARAEGLKVQMIPCRARFDRGAVQAIQACIEDEGIDIVHTHGYKADFYGFAAARPLGTKLIATAHNWTRLTSALRMFAWLDHFVLRRFDTVVAVSEPVAASLLRSGASADKIRTIDNGIDIGPFEDARPTLAAEIEKGDRVVVGAVGRLVAEKGFFHLLHAAPGILADFPDTLFVLVGDGPARVGLEAAAQDLGVRENVVFAGQRRDMPGVYASFDILVLPSLNEGMPLSILEGLASKRPVVASHVGAMPTVITSERSGLLVKPGDTVALQRAICRLLADPGLRTKLGANGSASVRQRFSAELMGRRYVEEYKQLIGKQRAA